MSATLANEEITGFQGQALLFGLCEVHFVEARQVELAPENVLSAEERTLVFTDPVLLRDLLSLLDSKERIKPLDSPIDWEFSEFS